ncbi:MAG TPA: hypothetical protein VGR56_01980 [Nitrososphaerales archaeon]|nr:hypothetical protein [Nitrososphaerales archaeon]
MNAIGWLFLYTPLPWVVAMCAWAYRHDLTRMARPARDGASQKEWWSACKYLGLVGVNVKDPGSKPWKSVSLIATIVSCSISLSWLLIPSMLVWYFLCLFQAAAAVPLLLVLVRAIGPIPFRPFRDVLPFPRLGTRIRHLKGLKATDTNFVEHPIGSPTPKAEPGNPP